MANKKGRTAAVTGVAAVAVVAVLLGSGKLGLGNGFGLGIPTGSNGKEEAAAVDIQTPSTQVTQDTAPAEDTQPAGIEIRIQGREYNYQNVSYGGQDHSLEELLTALDALPRDTRIDLSVEDNATKNAVDDLERALAEAGFTDIRK